MIFYAYFGYPLSLVGILASRRLLSRDGVRSSSPQQPNKPNGLDGPNRPNRPNGPTHPTVSLIITAHNEEKRIKEKIENSLKLEYPRQKLEIIVASDCSSDRTDEIVKSYSHKGVRLVRSPVRKGKEHAQKLAVAQAKGDILVFSDVATIIEPDGLRNIVANFEDSTVGCVSSVDKFINPDGSSSGEGAYVKYEMFLRSLESRVNTLVGLSGSFFAARRQVCHNWAEDLQSDFNTVLNSIKVGLKGVSDPKTIGYYKNIQDEKKEFHRKVRTVLRGISVLMRNLSLLNPLKYGMFSWQLFSHKLCRWLVPFFLLLAFFSNAVLVFKGSSILYRFLLIMQIAFYSAALVYHWIGSAPAVSKKPATSTIINWLKIPYYFLTVNASILVAWIKYLRGERATFWEPSER